MKIKFNKWYVIIFWAIFVVFMVTVLPQVAMATEQAGLEGSIDTNFSFNPSLILQIITDYGPEGRRYYLIQRWTFDATYPLIYALPLAASLWGLLLHSTYQRWAWLPMFAASFDYFENIAFSFLMLAFPNIGLIGVTFAVVLSSIKWLFLGSSYLFVLTLSLKTFLKVLFPKRV
jgi:hypothetical protein